MKRRDEEHPHCRVVQVPYAGRRTDFRDKNRAIFSEELFSGEELLPEKAVLG